MNQISFKGQFISNINIKRAGYPLPTHQAAIVEADPLKFHDLKALEDVDRLWDGNFSRCIYKDAYRINLNNAPDSKQKFFILTDQKENYNRLNSDDILAEAKVVLDYPVKGKVFIDYLQVQPENSFDSNNRTYEKLGTSFLSFLKKYYNNSEIGLRSLHSTVDFYIKNGFKLVRKDSTLMRLVKK